MLNNHRRRRLVAGLAVLGMGGSVALAAQPAQAGEPSEEPPIYADTGATLQVDSGNPNGVYIECSWALEDADNDWNTGMQYGDGDSTPYTKPGETPCQGGLGQGRPDQPRVGTEIHIDVLPNSHDLPTEQFVELWAAVDFLGDPQSQVNPLSMDWEVYHPDGTLKFQVPGSLYTNCYGPVDEYGSSMFGAAVYTGQVKPSAIQSQEGFYTDTIQNLCLQGEKHLFYGAFPISKHQPYGTYEIRAKANDNVGSSELVYSIDVLPFHDLQADFDTVQWPTLTRNAHRRVIGDFLLSTPERPTVVNRGNAGIGIEVKLSDMCLVGFEAQCGTVDSKRIDRFDSAFGIRHQTLVAVGDTQERPNVYTGDQGATPIPGGTWMHFNLHGDIQPEQSLCPNDRGKVEFSLYTKPNQEQGDYAGNVKVRAVTLATTPNGIVSADIAEQYPDGAPSYCPTDNGSVYYGDFFYNQYEVDYAAVTNGYWAAQPS